MFWSTRWLVFIVGLIFVFGVGCSDDSEKRTPDNDVEVGVDVSGDDVGEDANSSVGDVQELEDVAQDASLSDVGGKVPTGEECPEECVFPDWSEFRCDSCAMGWCYLRGGSSQGKPTYCTGGCSVNAECAGYGDGWSCTGSPGVCVKE